MAFHLRKLMLAGPEEKPGLHPANHPIPNLLVLFLGIAGATFLLLSYFAMRRFASRRRSSPPLVNGVREEDFADGLRGAVIDHPIWHIRTVGYPQSVMDSIQTVMYRKGEGLIETSDCSVCLSEFEEGENLRLLPKCSHAFHVACIDTWLRSHTNCPLCRAPIFVAVHGNQSSDPVESSESERGGGGNVEDDDGDGVLVIHEEEEMEAVRRSVSLDFSSISIAEPKNLVSIKRSVSFSLFA